MKEEVYTIGIRDEESMKSVNRLVDALCSARRWARAWKTVAKMFKLMYERGHRLRREAYEESKKHHARIQTLEGALRHAADVLQDAGLPRSAATARELLGETK